MAITIKYETIKDRFNPEKWDSIEEYEQYYLHSRSETQSHTNYYSDKNAVERIISPVNHHPELKEYEVWESGWAATGGSGEAKLIGKAKARNFAQACHIVQCKRYLENVEEQNNPEYKEYTTPGRWDYNPRELTYWGCGLYWSEELARKSFG